MYYLLFSFTQLLVRAASNTIREKPDWWIKLNNPEIVAKWRQEFLDTNAGRELRFQMTDKQIDYLVKELQWYAERRQEQVDLKREGQGKEGEVVIDVGIEGTRRADGLVPEELKSRLVKCVRKLEDVPDEKKDWHPGSNNKVLDLVHPSLFPFVAGRTRVMDKDAIPALESIGQGEPKDVPPKPNKHRDMYYSKKFQWLSTDFDVTPEGKTKAKTYINNLHPVEHKEMYPVLEEILDKFLPLFEEVLGEMEVEGKNKRFKVNPYEWHEEMPDFGDDNEARWAYEKVRIPKPLEIPEFTPPEEIPKYDLKNTGKPLQVIVKLANIELTPDNPKYEGGTWHVEGMANDNIAATGIYYYHSDNISESRLNFRIQVHEPEYDQYDDSGVLHMYDLENEGPLVQPLDGIITKQDRCLVFPNIYQHEVQPFELQDPTRPGTRKILVFFLVNPEEPTLSTTRVPPQQKEWVQHRVAFEHSVQDKLPTELLDEIYSMVDWPMDLEEAKTLREELMNERKYLVKNLTADVFERPFYLSEH
ncbi:hypothetical protein KI688_000891 [Linnemannia hyalina]|uniref:Fe2OG dioxygenase domain-containing protein n=1 Tax=Linnemannia hyalina TaxID=64524 RepID=A0A9P8BXX5_9FUNG|nr:hypothetical protein KI688_000891 [Linnemannia hyalina]